MGMSDFPETCNMLQHINCIVPFFIGGKLTETERHCLPGRAPICRLRTFSKKILPGCTEYDFDQHTVSYQLDDSIYKMFYKKHNFQTYSILLRVKERLMITSDEEIEYSIFALFSDIGGGLGIFLGLSFLRFAQYILRFL